MTRMRMMKWEHGFCMIPHTMPPSEAGIFTEQ